MRVGRMMAGVLVCGLLAVCSTGCVSIERYREQEAALRQARAQQELLQRDLYDERTVTNSLRTRADALERELESCNQLLASHRNEKDLLTDALGAARRDAERLAGMQRLDPIEVAPKLPQPLDSALKMLAQAHPNDVEYDARTGHVRWKSDLLFALGSDVVRDASRAALRDFANVLKSSVAADFEVLIIGHTDNKPITPQTQAKHPTNWHLSAHRAISVSRVLLDSGYSSDRISVAGCSEYRPVASNATEAGATQNRRVEVYLVPLGSVVPRTAMTGS